MHRVNVPKCTFCNVSEDILCRQHRNLCQVSGRQENFKAIWVEFLNPERNVLTHKDLKNF